MRPAAGAAHLVQVVLDPLRRDLLLLVRPRHPQVSGVRQRPGWSSADGGIEEFPLFRGNTAPAAKT
jgi:hypothetical protein